MEFVHKCVWVVLVTASLGPTRTQCNCTFKNIRQCNDPMKSLTEAQLGDSTIICQKLKETTDCFDKVSESCPPFMKSSIEMALAETDYLQQTCHGASGGCSIHGFVGCTSRLQNMTMEEYMDPDVVCPVALTSYDCLAKEMDTCPRFMQNRYQTKIDELETSRTICEYHLDNPDPDSSQCSLQEIFMCSMPLETMSDEETDNLKILCPVLVKSVECTLSEMDTCPDALKSELRRTMFALERRGRYCQFLINSTDHASSTDSTTMFPGGRFTRGYGTTDSMSHGVWNFLDSGSSDSGKSGFWNSDSDSGNSDSGKSGFWNSDSNSGNSDSGKSGFWNSDTGSSDSGKSGFWNSDSDSGNSDSGKSGFWNSDTGSSDSGKSGFWNSDSGNTGAIPPPGSGNAETRSAKSGGLESTNPDPRSSGEGQGPGSSSGGGGACSQMAMMTCIIPVQTMSPTDRRNLDVVCPATTTAVACLTSQMNACPAVIKPMYQMALTQMSRGVKLCSDHWSSTGHGLKSSLWTLLVAAMLAAIRHFL